MILGPKFDLCLTIVSRVFEIITIGKKNFFGYYLSLKMLLESCKSVENSRIEYKTSYLPRFLDNFEKIIFWTPPQNGQIWSKHKFWYFLLKTISKTLFSQFGIILSCMGQYLWLHQKHGGVFSGTLCTIYPIFHKPLNIWTNIVI